MDKLGEILWKFHNELNEQQRSGLSVTQGNTEIFASTIQAIIDLVPEEKPELPAMRNKMHCSQCGQIYYSEDIGWNACRQKILKKMGGV